MQEPVEQSTQERVEVSEELIPLSIPIKTYQFFLATREECPDALDVWLHLYFTALRQNNPIVKANDTYMRNGLHIGRDRLQRAKKFLKDHDLIEYVQGRDPDTGAFVKGGEVRIFLKSYTKPAIRESRTPDRSTEKPVYRPTGTPVNDNNLKINNQSEEKKGKGEEGSRANAHNIRTEAPATPDPAPSPLLALVRKEQQDKGLRGEYEGKASFEQDVDNLGADLTDEEANKLLGGFVSMMRGKYPTDTFDGKPNYKLKFADQWLKNFATYARQHIPKKRERCPYCGSGSWTGTFCYDCHSAKGDPFDSTENVSQNDTETRVSDTNTSCQAALLDPVLTLETA